MDRAELTRFVKAKALEVGFHRVGIAAADRVDTASFLEKWLGAGRHGTMAYMQRHFEKRCDPRELFPGARSVVSVALNYYTPHPTTQASDQGKISRYAWGDDYHDVVKDRLFALLDAVREAAPGVEGKCCVDTAPMLDKYWAVQAGIGWMGKHTNVITRDLGSWVFLGEVILDCELDADSPIADFCGSCTRCLDACPTDAFPGPYEIDASRCLSYLTIEHRAGAFDFDGDFDNWIFGCDVCQDVCPWNHKLGRPTDVVGFEPRGVNVDQPLGALAEMTVEDFRARFRKSPVKRTKHGGFVRNVKHVMGQQRRHDDPA